MNHVWESIALLYVVRYVSLPTVRMYSFVYGNKLRITIMVLWELCMKQTL